MRYAKTEYWLAKEERAEQERKEREYEITQEDIDDIKYQEARENGELDYIFGKYHILNSYEDIGKAFPANYLK